MVQNMNAARPSTEDKDHYSPTNLWQSNCSLPPVALLLEHFVPSFLSFPSLSCCFCVFVATVNNQAIDINDKNVTGAQTPAARARSARAPRCRAAAPCDFLKNKALSNEAPSAKIEDSVLRSPV
jgi:hypothetical protein